MGPNNNGQDGGFPNADIDAPEAWDYSTGSKEIVVGILDSGVQYDHPDLVNNMWINPYESGEMRNDGIDNDGNGYIDDYHGWDFHNNDNDPMDESPLGHGTLCAGPVGAQGNNALGITGVNWNVSIAAIKISGFYGHHYLSDTIEAHDYATNNNIPIINCSWGYREPSLLHKEAIERAGDANQLVIVACGNSGNNLDEYSPRYPACYDNWNIISVANTDRNDDLSISSNYGKESVDLAAPGTDILTTSAESSHMYFPEVSDGYRYATGTSLSAPWLQGRVPYT